MLGILALLALVHMTRTHDVSWDDPFFVGPYVGLKIIKRDEIGNMKILKRMDGSSQIEHGYLKRILKCIKYNPHDENLIRVFR